MINFSAFEQLRSRYGKTEMPFLVELRETAKANKMFDGLKILHSIPLTIEAVLKIEPLLLGGAEVTASCTTIVPPNKEAVRVLKAANVKVKINHKFQEEFDFHLDCCGELLNVAPPKMGAIELTQSGSKLYQNAKCNYPVISIDDSALKLLETIFGTGDGFVRALMTGYNKDIYDKKIIIFGYGKVGRGIAHALMEFTNNVIVIDVGQVAMDTALQQGLQYLDGRAIEKIKQEVASASFIVTATGVKGLLTDCYHFCKADFGKAVLTNMGASDEYGSNFAKQDVLFEKKPLNFSIPEPTIMKYLDPVLYAHNIAIQFILSGKIINGYNPFPKKDALKILAKWSKLHKEKLFDI